MGHGALESAGIDLGRGDQPLFDHRNALANLELADPVAGERSDDRHGTAGQDRDDRNHERPGVQQSASSELLSDLIRLAASGKCFTPAAKQFPISRALMV